MGFASAADGGFSHADARLFMIRSKLAQTDNPIVFVGDSLTEAATLPSSICGHDVVNAGIGGAASNSYLSLARQLFDGKKFPVVVLAIGTNDSQKSSRPPPAMRASYFALVEYLASRAGKMIIVGIPPMEMKKLAKDYFDVDYSDRNNEIVKAIAADKKLRFVDLRSSMTGENLTIDGVHLTPAGYMLWNGAIAKQIGQLCS